MNFGAPQELFSDGGKNLWSGVVQAFLRTVGTKHKGSSPYHPQTNGKVECLNGILEDMISKYLVGKPTRLWDQYLNQALFTCRICTNHTTKISPYFLVYGQQPHLLWDSHVAMEASTPAMSHEQRLLDLWEARRVSRLAAYECSVKDKAT